MRLEDWYRATERPEEREILRKMRRKAIMETVGVLVLIPIAILLFCMYLVATPDWPGRGARGITASHPETRGTTPPHPETRGATASHPEKMEARP